MGAPWPLTHHSIAYDGRNIVCNELLLEKSFLSARVEWYYHHQTIQPLQPTIFFDTTLGWVRSIWKSTGATLWPNKPQVAVTILKSRDSLIIIHQTAIISVIAAGYPLICQVRVLQIAPMIHGATIKCLPGKKILLVPENILLIFKSRPLIETLWVPVDK